MQRVAGVDAERFCTPCPLPMAGRSCHLLSHARIYAAALGPYLSKLAYMSHVVGSRERVSHGYLCSDRRRAARRACSRRRRTHARAGRIGAGQHHLRAKISGARPGLLPGSASRPDPAPSYDQRRCCCTYSPGAASELAASELNDHEVSSGELVRSEGVARGIAPRGYLT